MGRLLRKIFENFHAVVMAISVPFESFSRKFCLNFLTLRCNSECFAKYDACCAHIFDYACLRPKDVRLIPPRKRFEIMKKLHTSKTFLKIAGGRMHTPHPNPLDPPLAISCRNHQKSLAYFGNFAPIILFLFTKKQSQKGGPWPNAPL